MRRVLSASSIVIVALATVAIAVSCGVPQQDDSGGVTTTSALPGGEDARDVSASKKGGKIPVCHKGKDKLVPPHTLDRHLAHGDTEGPCTPPCPCFTEQDITDALPCGQKQCVRIGNGYLVRLVCTASPTLDFYADPSPRCLGPSTDGYVPTDATQYGHCSDTLLTSAR